MEKEKYGNQVCVEDGIGNIQEDTFIISKEPEAELYQIELPERIDIAIDPYGIENDYQIYSGNNVIKNMNYFPIKVAICSQYSIRNAKLVDYLNPCEINFWIEEKGKLDILQENEMHYVEFYLDSGEAVDIKLKGSVMEGTEDIWGVGDIGIKMSFRFEKERGLVVNRN